MFDNSIGTGIDESDDSILFFVLVRLKNMVSLMSVVLVLSRMVLLLFKKQNDVVVVVYEQNDVVVVVFQQVACQEGRY